ncbi:MAG: energy transducer TonB [Pyrinomonadaceae bacterium]
MSFLSCRVFSIIVLLTGGLLSVVAAQSQASIDWETLRPQGEEFTVLMPKGSTFESSKEPYHKMELNSRIYLSNRQGGPVFAVVSLSGIKANPALYSEMQRVNSYVDAFKNLFPPKLSLKPPAPVKLTLEGEKALQGHMGRAYRLSVGALSGTVQAFTTRKRFYALVYLNSKKDDSIQDEFVSSFDLPEKGAEPPPTLAAQNPATMPQSPQRTNKTPAEEAAAAEAAVAADVDTKPEAAAGGNAQPAKRRPISGGVLNGKAIVLPKPDYPVDARTAGVAGSVAVQVTIDEMGMVIEAKAVSGPPLLHQPSVNAALQARFSPTSLMGEPVRVTGVIVYNFVRQ